ncbi:MAG: YIP1 family protein [Chloroflexales bacterium]|nr:YIP1 family protein [Chloroflexales bacterium]
MMDTFNGALTLNRTLLLGLHESPNVVQRGLAVVLLVGLLVGGVKGALTMLNAINPERAIATTRTELKNFVEEQAQLSSTPEQRAAIDLMEDNLEPGLEIWQATIELPTPLPRPVGAIFRGLGVMVAEPLTYLGNLLLWVIFTHIAARWLGGQGNIQQMLGLGALSVAPHALDALAFIPFIGQALGLIASLWGLVILTIGTSVAHRLEIGRAIMAVVLFPLIGLVLGVLGCCLLFFAIVALGAGAG